MKLLVNAVQLLIVIAIIFPILSLWEKDRVDKFCKKIEPGMTQQTYLDLIEQEFVNLEELVGEEVIGGNWHATVTTFLPTDYRCLTEGHSKLVKTTAIVEEDEED